MRRTLCCVVLVGVVFSGVAPAAEEADNAGETSSLFASRVIALTDVVLQNHIDPPTRQQMLLAGVRALYRAEERLAPNGLSGRISELATRDQIEDYLAEIRADFAGLPKAEAILTSGMLEALPGHSFLINDKVSKVQGQLAANRYVGTGIALRMDKEDKLPAISKVFYGGPAWQAGIKQEDLIIRVESEATASKELNQIVEELRGEEGSDVTVVVRQPDATESRTVTITRGRVFIPSVEGYRQESEADWQYTIDSAEEIAFIRIKSFGPSTLHELRQIEAQLQPLDLRGIILDVRSGGGILHDVVMVADGLLEGGVIGHVRSLNSSQTYEARPGSLFRSLPMAVLIGRNANADRVFLTAALQDQGRAIVVGERTSGETYVSSLVSVPGRSCKIRMATAVMQRGDGTLLLARGNSWFPPNVAATRLPRAGKRRPGFIVPDHPVAALGTNQLGEDPLVAKAIEVLRSAGTHGAL